MAIEIVDFPMKIVIFHSYVKLPEGRYPSNAVVLVHIQGFVGDPPSYKLDFDPNDPLSMISIWSP